MLAQNSALSPTLVSEPLSTGLDFLWLEITGKCNLECVHCYADSSPRGTHGSMSTEDWTRVLNEAASLGCKRVQFIGGEPTLHPGFATLVRKAKDCGLAIEVYSNLVTVSDRLWDLFKECNVELATSFYSDDPAVQDRITQRAGSQKRTLHNIAQASSRGQDIRVGLIAMDPDQDVAATIELLETRNVTSVKTDHLREVGRGQQKDVHNFDALCGHCSGPVAAIDPEGRVYPCVFSRWLPVGNVREESLSSVLAGSQLKGTRATLDEVFSKRHDLELCHPNYCEPYCGPISKDIAENGPWGDRMNRKTASVLKDTPCPPNGGGCVPDCSPYTCRPFTNRAGHPSHEASSRNCPPVGCPPTCGPRCSPADQCLPYHQRHTEA